MRPSTVSRTTRSYPHASIFSSPDPSALRFPCGIRTTCTPIRLVRCRTITLATPSLLGIGELRRAGPECMIPWFRRRSRFLRLAPTGTTKTLGRSSTSTVFPGSRGGTLARGVRFVLFLTSKDPTSQTQISRCQPAGGKWALGKETTIARGGRSSKPRCTGRAQQRNRICTKTFRVMESVSRCALLGVSGAFSTPKWATALWRQRLPSSTRAAGATSSWFWGSRSPMKCRLILAHTKFPKMSSALCFPR
mmetsp:Transcript_30208/g.70569  ORF Transcript_30208/g.70569 Transcript_30208/m.70569 type:complete len:249 (+) Transcript_30208:823-1569(+)